LVVATPDTEADPRFVPVKVEGEVLGGDEWVSVEAIMSIG